MTDARTAPASVPVSDGSESVSIVGLSAAGLRWGGVQWNPSNMTLPRVRVWPCDEQLLVFIGFADGNCDPVVGIDLYVTGRLGDWLSGWLWERGRIRSERRRAA